MPSDPPKSQTPFRCPTLEQLKQSAGESKDTEKGSQAHSVQSVPQKEQDELKGSDVSSRTPESRQSRWSCTADVRSNHAATGGRASQSVIVPVKSRSAPGHSVRGKASQASSQGFSECAVDQLDRILAQLTVLQSGVSKSTAVLEALMTDVQAQHVEFMSRCQLRHISITSPFSLVRKGKGIGSAMCVDTLPSRSAADVKLALID